MTSQAQLYHPRPLVVHTSVKNDCVQRSIIFIVAGLGNIFLKKTGKKSRPVEKFTRAYLSPSIGFSENLLKEQPEIDNLDELSL
jgi:hypothetical protein